MITAKLKGGLGNKMFQMASTIGIAINNNLDWGFDFGEDGFNNLHTNVDCSYKKTVKVPWGYHDIKVDDDAILDGYMQSEKYFAHCKSLIKYLFNIDYKSDLLVPFSAIHFRGGDYTGNKCHNVLDKDYWDKAISLLPNDPIMVFTDDIDAAREMFNNKYPVASNRDMYDMYVITRAKSIIMSNSTFSWWGAWLSNAETVIAPKKWFGGKKATWDTTDLYCDEWIKI